MVVVASYPDPLGQLRAQVRYVYLTVLALFVNKGKYPYLRVCPLREHQEVLSLLGAAEKSLLRVRLIITISKTTLRIYCRGRNIVVSKWDIFAFPL